jgi:hypothetical protein
MKLDLGIQLIMPLTDWLGYQLLGGKWNALAQCYMALAG